MNFEEIKASVAAEFDHDVDSYAWSEGGKSCGSVTEVHQQGGEGEGDHWEKVFHYTDHDVMVKITGHYQSYRGTEFYDGFDGCVKEVKPVTKTITVYE